VPTIPQIRGALLEEAVLFLLKNVGYEVIEVSSLGINPVPGLRAGHSGLEVGGRGTWHQLDALALWTHSPAFMYPLRLIVEAKCYKARRPIELKVVRNAVGVAKDISENYFTVQSRTRSFQAPRYNYASAIFSTSGYTAGAVEYAVAHQVFLIDYQHIPIIRSLIEAIMQFDETCVSELTREAIRAARIHLRNQLSIGEQPEELTVGYLTGRGRTLIETAITQSVRQIGGSYFGMLQGRWPMHLLRDEPLPPAAFTTDIVLCRVRGNERGEWRFEPRNFSRDQDGWFELEFNLPPIIAGMVAESWDDRITIANLKQEHFSYIDLSGLIGGVRRNVRLQLDRDWLNEYITRRTERVTSPNR
jgi:hypothetical protein